MYNENESSKNSFSHVPTTVKNSKTMIISRNNFYHRWNSLYVIITITIISLTIVNGLPHHRSNQRTIRLCSKSLSDALYLVCSDRGGYNEPFSYSSEIDSRGTAVGPGLVEECCYRSCSYEQLEQYCKPLSNDKTNGNDDAEDGIEESVRIVKLPFTEISSENRRALTSDQNDDQRTNDKSKIRNLTRLRKKKIVIYQRMKIGRKIDREERIRASSVRFNCDNDNNYKLESDNYSGKDDTDVRTTTRRYFRRHGRQKRPRRGKAPRDGTLVSVPEFKVGTILPEPDDSVIIVFPSRTINL